MWQGQLDACPPVVQFVASVPGLAFLHRLVLALHVVFVEIGACGMRLVCLFLEMTGRNRFVGASLFAAILASVAIPPAPLSPPRRAVE
jgi:hypothetical protein